MELVEFFGVIAIVLLFTKWFEPIQGPKNKVVEWLIGKVVWLGMKWKPLFSLTRVVKLLTCPFCLSFWTLLYITHNLFIAASGSIVAMIVDNTIVKTQNND